MPVIASAKLTENKTQFFGITTIEYRDQMAPVAVSDNDWFNDNLSAGLSKNFRKFSFGWLKILPEII